MMRTKPLIPHLFRSKRFAPVFWAQMSEAFNGNMFQLTLVSLMTLRLSSNELNTVSAVLAGIFILPCFFFSYLAGQMADKYNRNTAVKIVKKTEIVIIGAAVLAALAGAHVILVACLFALGMTAAFFMPFKYALLPQHLNQRELIAGNTYFSLFSALMVSFGAIVAATMPVFVAFILLLASALIGYTTSKNIPESPAGRPDMKINRGFFSGSRDCLRQLVKHPIIFRAVLGSTWFTALSAMLLIKLLSITQDVLNVAPTVYAFFVFTLAVGFGFGCFMCKRMLRGVVHTTYVPLSSIAMGFALFALYILFRNYPAPEETATFWTFLTMKGSIAIPAALWFLGFFSGVFIIPLNVVIQQKAPQEYIGTILGADQLCLFLGVAMMTFFTYFCSSVGIHTPVLFLLVSLIDLFIAIYTCVLLPADLLRSLIRSVLAFCFDIKVKGLENFTAAGKRVIIVANHTSLMDGLLIAAFMPDKLSFAVSLEWAGKWYTKVLNLLVDLIPIDQTNPMSLRTVIDEVKKNKKVVIFPEGRISVTGSLMKIHESMGMVAEKTKAKILPLCLSGPQYSKFSFAKDRFSSQFFPAITMTVLAPKDFSVPDTMKSRQRRQNISNRLYDVMAEMMYRGGKTNENIFVSILKARSVHGWRNCVFEDASRKKMNYGSFVLKCYVLGGALARCYPTEEKIGVMLPNVLAAPVTVFGLMAVDKVPVMLNFSAGPAQVASCVKTTALKTVLTSKKFVEVAKLEHLVAAITEAGAEVVYLEDFAKKVTLWDKLRGISASFSGKKPKNSADSPAIILFTSGSEGLPKAVVLSHKNIHANRNQFSAILSLDKKDIVFNALPLFHSFGMCLATVMPVVSGMKCFLYPSPLHYRIIPQLAYEIDATIICGTDTFLAAYGKTAHPYDFYRLKYAAIGGEKLKESTAELWMRKFGVRLIEGYGTTEAAPLVAANSPMHTKLGTVGRLLPGMEYRLEPVEGWSQGGKLWIKGENIMLGYIKADKPNVLQPPEDGWYDTGDIVDIDDEGYITILGRAKRFAKIGGEMVSLTAVELTLDKMRPDFIYEVVAINDDKKGEQLVLITNNDAVTVPDMVAFFKENGLSELWVPKKVHFMAEPPLLGTGKYNYPEATKIAMEQFS